MQISREAERERQRDMLREAYIYRQGDTKGIHIKRQRERHIYRERDSGDYAAIYGGTGRH